MAVSTPLLRSLYHLPLSIEAYEKFQEHISIIQGLQLQPSHDKSTYIWGFSSFSSRNTYKRLIGHQHVPRAFKWLCKSACQNKRKFFFWLILKDCLSTRPLLKRRNMHLPNYNCVFCSLNVEEDIFHLVFDGPFASSYWFSLNLMVSNNSDPLDIMESFKDQLRLPFLWRLSSQCVT